MRIIKKIVRITFTAIGIAFLAYSMFLGGKCMYDAYPNYMESTKCIDTKVLDINGKLDMYALVVKEDASYGTISLYRGYDCAAYEQHRDDILPHTWYNWVALIIGSIAVFIVAALLAIAIVLMPILALVAFLEELAVDWINSGKDRNWKKENKNGIHQG